MSASMALSSLIARFALAALRRRASATAAADVAAPATTVGHSPASSITCHLAVGSMLAGSRRS